MKLPFDNTVPNYVLADWIEENDESGHGKSLAKMLRLLPQSATEMFMARLAFRPYGTCTELCAKFPELYTRYTRYEDDNRNFGYACEDCIKDDNRNMTEQWNEYYSNQL